MNTPTLPSDLIAELHDVEQIVIERLHTQRAVISVAGAQLAARGERRRAAITLVAARVGGTVQRTAIHAAATAELIAAAAETHSALVDAARRRRNEQPREAWEHGVSLMVGDYLYALAAGEMALVSDPRAIGYFAEAVRALSEAELSPPSLLIPSDLARQVHAAYHAGRVAALFRAAAMAGVAVGGGDERLIDILGAYGEQVGFAWQLQRELADFAPEGRAESLAQGRVSRPLIEAAERGDRELLARALDDPTLHPQATAAIRADGLAATTTALTTYRTAIVTILAELAPSSARELLQALIP